MAMKKMRLAIDIGGTAIKCGLADENLELSEVKEYATPHFGPEILELLVRIVEDYGMTPANCSGICVSSTGVIDSENGVVVIVSEELMPGFTGARIRETLENASHIPCHVENDVNCAALAEYRLGAGVIRNADGTARAAKSMLMLTVGTGIGGAYIEEGRLLQGVTDSACEVGYIRIGDEYLEDVASTHVMVRRVQEAFPGVEGIDGKWIFRKVDEGDETCIREVDRLTDLLARGISDICCVLNPEIVVIGGGISVRGDVLGPKLNAGLDRHLIPVIREGLTLRFAGNMNRAGMLGACIAAEKRT